MGFSHGRLIYKLINLSTHRRVKMEQTMVFVSAPFSADLDGRVRIAAAKLKISRSAFLHKALRICCRKLKQNPRQQKWRLLMQINSEPSKLLALFDRLSQIGRAMQRARQTAANGEAYQGLTPEATADAKSAEADQHEEFTSSLISPQKARGRL
jgi:hypothetical protein